MTVSELQEAVAGQTGETLVMFNHEHITGLEVMSEIPSENMEAYVNLNGIMR